MTAAVHMTRDRWSGIEIRHLEALDAVARLGSFVSAAHELGYVSSAISQQIDYLERLVGHRLIERGRAGRPLRLTRPGELFLAHAREVLTELSVAERGLVARPEPRPGTLRVGCQSLLTQRAESSVAESLTRLLGDRAEPVRRCGGDLLAALEDGELDAVVHELPVPPERYSALEVRRERLVLAVQTGSGLAARTRGAPADLAGAVLVDIVGCRATRALRTELEQTGVAVEWRFRVASAAAARTLVAAGAGVAVLPETEAQDASVSAVAVAGAARLPLERSQGIVWLRARDGDCSLEPIRTAARCLTACSGLWHEARAA